MSYGRLLTQPLVLQRRNGSTRDEYGNAVLGAYGDPINLFGYLEQKKSDEFLVDRDTVVSTHHAFLPADAEIGYLDIILFQGQKYEVHGAPKHHFNPRTKQVEAISVDLKVVL